MDSRMFKTRSALENFIRSQKPQTWSIAVLHDDACSPSRCTCKPWYRATPATVEVLKAAAAEQEDWVKKSSS